MFPLPGSAPAVVAAPAPGKGPEFWAGAPCAVLDEDGTYLVAYRVRNGPNTTDQTVVARSEDGERLTTILTLDQDHFGAQWTERPALVRTETGRWRLYVGCATPNTKHWWIAALEAATPEALGSADITSAFAGDEQTAVKDPIVRRTGGAWQAWICCHLLDVPGAEDRMNTAYATSADGLDWDWHGTVLEGRPGEWDARAAPASRRSCPTAAPPTTAARPRRRTGSNAPDSPARTASASSRPASPSPTPATSRRCRCRAAASVSTTRPACPTRATSCGRS